jgi:hypothetical protein
MKVRASCPVCGEKSEGSESPLAAWPWWVKHRLERGCGGPLEPQLEPCV